jgi:hypothetical protein
MARQNVIENKGQTKKRGNPNWIKGGTSPNPSGRPKNETSITYWLHEFGGMTSEQVAELAGVYAREFKQLKTGDVPLAAIVALRAYMSLINDITPGMFGHVLDRVDGAVTQKIAGDDQSPLTIRVEYVKRFNTTTHGTSSDAGSGEDRSQTV